MGALKSGTLCGPADGVAGHPVWQQEPHRHRTSAAPGVGFQPLHSGRAARRSCRAPTGARPAGAWGLLSTVRRLSAGHEAQKSGCATFMQQQQPDVTLSAAAAAGGRRRAGRDAGAAAGQKCEGGAASGVRAHRQLRRGALCRGALCALNPLLHRDVLRSQTDSWRIPDLLGWSALPSSLQEAAAAADALGRSGAFAVCQLVLDSVPAAFALSLRAGLPPPVQALAPLGPVAFFDRRAVL